MATNSVRKILNKIPPKWRWSLISWALAALFSWIIMWLFGLQTLLAIYLVIFAIASIIGRYGEANWAITQFIKHLRGIMIFALLPAIWPVIKEIMTNFSWVLIVELLLIGYLIVYVWQSFDKVIERLTIKRIID